MIGSDRRARAGKPCYAYGCLARRGNRPGGREHGQKSDQMSGYHRRQPSMLDGFAKLLHLREHVPEPQGVAAVSWRPPGECTNMRRY